MIYPPKVITDATVEPISLAEAQAQGRIDTTTAADDSLIEDIFIPAARRYLEDRTGRTFHQKTLEWIFDRFPCSSLDPLCLRLATPLITVTSVKYKDSAAAETTWGASNYIVDVDASVGRIVPAYQVQWPIYTPYPIQSVRVRGTAGIATASPITEAGADIKYPMCMLVAAMFENREAESIPERSVMDTLSFKYGVEAYISKLKVEYAF